MKNEFIYPLRVYIEDTDCTGVVYHANYLHFMERARSEWFEALDLGIAWMKERDRQFLIHSLNIQYLNPARAHEQIEVVTSIKEMRAASIIFAQHLHLRSMPDKILCKAEVKIVCVDFSMHPRAIPHSPIFDAIRRTLS
jgi:acyl-CoA thioester hydrolase